MSARLPQPDEPLVLSNGTVNPVWYEFFADNYAYTPYTPTVTAGSGTFTTVSATGRYKKRGRTVDYNITVVITTVGTASGRVMVTLPFASGPVAQSGTGRETASTGSQLQSEIAAGASSMDILEYDNTTAAASGSTLVMSGSYESAE